MPRRGRVVAVSTTHAAPDSAATDLRTRAPLHSAWSRYWVSQHRRRCCPERIAADRIGTAILVLGWPRVVSAASEILRAGPDIWQHFCSMQSRPEWERGPSYCWWLSRHLLA